MISDASSLGLRGPERDIIALKSSATDDVAREVLEAEGGLVCFFFFSSGTSGDVYFLSLPSFLR